MKKIKYLSLIMLMILMLTGCGSSEKVALANVVHPTSADYLYYTFNEVKNYDKVNVIGIKLKHK